MDSPRATAVSSRASGPNVNRFGDLTCILALVMALAGCGDETLETTVAFRLHGPPSLGSDGRCPATADTTPIAGQPSAVRLTYRFSGGGLLVCDALVEFGVPNQVVAVPAEPGSLIDVFAEVYADDGAGGVRLIGTGETRGVDLAEPEEIRIFVTPREQFACARERATVPRAFHTATAMPDGTVLLAGGAYTAATEDQLLLTNSLELYDHGDFRPIAAQGAVPRAFHSAMVLGDDGSGRVRIALFGGITVSGDPATVPGLIAAAGAPFRLVPGPGTVGAPTEIITYDPEAGTASIAPVATGDVVPRLFGTRSRGIAALGGGWVDAERSAANYSLQGLDPSTGAATYTVDLIASRYGATVTAVSPTRAIVWGGHLDTAADSAGALAGEVLELSGTPAIGAIGFTDPELPTPRAFHAAAATGNGDLIIAGGFEITSGSATAPAATVVERLRYGPVSLLTPLAPSGDPAVPAGYVDALSLRDGDVLISGGNPAAADCTSQTSELTCAIASAYRYRSGAESLTHLPPLQVGRYGHASAQLDDDVALVTGGLRDDGGALEVTNDAELFNPRTPDYDPIADLQLGRAPGQLAHECVLLTAPGD